MYYSSPSYSKINIGLRITGKRPDGFHNLESIFLETDLCDEITVGKTRKNTRIYCDNPELPLDSRNICFRTFEFIKDSYNLTGGVEIEIKKKIPLGAGLGGGSSNAAVCLKLFNQIFHLGLSKQILIHLAAQIGSDVPFFIFGKSALVKGRGEIVQPISFFKFFQIVIVYPNIAIHTGWVYKNLEMDLTENRYNPKFKAVINKVKKIEDLNNYFYNDLERVVIKTYPVISEIKKQLRKLGAGFVSLSGSGSAVFGLFENQVGLEAIGEQLQVYGQVFFARPVQ
jgi:4-diphosphocytidyl-2-C-methyl-D-erythritol kinase